MSDWQLLALEYLADYRAALIELSHWPYFAYLDSCANHSSGRYDYIAASPWKIIKSIHGVTMEVDEKGERVCSTSPLSVLQSYLPSASSEPTSLPFTNGAIGYVSYDYGLSRVGLSANDKPGPTLPEVFFGLYPFVMVIDHVLQKASLCYDRERFPETKLKALLAIWQRTKVKAPSFKLRSNFKSNLSQSEYRLAFNQIKKHLLDGDSYQVNFSHCFNAAYEGCPFVAYLRLREVCPVPYGAFLRLDEGDVLSLSPELFFSLDKKGQIITKPIKGTIKRKPNSEDDEKAKQNLMTSEKDRAENTMIVDLLRNDISQIAKPFSVSVPSLCAIESFANVHHLVSTVSGSLSRQTPLTALFDALFPGGSITGAPKYRSMQIINQLEKSSRSVYCGAIGYINGNGEMMFNIAIRTLIASRQRLYCYAGGGIVIDSSAANEYQETLDKVSLLTETLQTANAQSTNYSDVDLRQLSAHSLC